MPELHFTITLDGPKARFDTPDELAAFLWERDSKVNIATDLEWWCEWAAKDPEAYETLMAWAAQHKDSLDDAVKLELFDALVRSAPGQRQGRTARSEFRHGLWRSIARELERWHGTTKADAALILHGLDPMASAAHIQNTLSRK